MVSSYEGEFQFPVSTTLTKNDVHCVVANQMFTPFGRAIHGEFDRIMDIILDECDYNINRLAGKTFYIDFQINQKDN
jgi:hypothetical protein